MSNINLIMPVEWPALITNSLPKASALHACKQTRCRSAYLWVPLQQLQGNAGQGKACCRLPSNVLCTQVASCTYTHGCWTHIQIHLSLLDVYIIFICIYACHFVPAIRDAPLSKKCSFFEHCSKGLWPPPPFIWTFVLFCRGCFRT